MKNTKEIGTYYEKQCSLFLIKKGYTIKKHNYRSSYGEIDIIAEKNDTIYFVEVKSSNHDYKKLLYKLTKIKQKKIIKTALDYIVNYHYNDTQINFIYMIVSQNKIRYYENAINIDLT